MSLIVLYLLPSLLSFSVSSRAPSRSRTELAGMASEKLSVRQKHKDNVSTHLSELEITTGRETPPTLDSLRNYVQQQESRETYRRWYRIPFEGEEETSSQET